VAAMPSYVRHAGRGMYAPTTTLVALGDTAMNVVREIGEGP
jgi:hypothetical protein